MNHRQQLAAMQQSIEPKTYAEGIEAGLKIAGLTSEAIAYLECYAFPENPQRHHAMLLEAFEAGRKLETDIAAIKRGVR